MIYVKSYPRFSFHTTFFMLCTALLLPSCNYAISTTDDTDGDGVADERDGCPNDPNKIEPGNCGCGKSEDTVSIGGQLYCLYPKNNDKDSDRDGVVDEDDGCPNKSFKYEPGLCGCEGYDLDQDNDGIVDTCRTDDESSAYIEKEDGSKIKFPDQCPDDSNKTKPGMCGCGVEDIDQDGDGFIDGCGEGGEIKIFPDRCPDDPQKQNPGICGCDIPDDDEDEDGAFFCGENHPNTTDHCPDDSDKTEPGICGCGKVDDELDTDGDGTPDCIDNCPNDEGKTEPGICGCGKVENELDTDGDGTPDCVDTCYKDSEKIEPGICGCGILDDDKDEDGAFFCGENHPNTTDDCPDDSDKTEPGICGCGIPDDDEDKDGYIFCGGGHPQNQDLCPNDPTRQAPGICGCGSSGNDGEIDSKKVCIENGGILQVGPTPDACTDDTYAMIEAFKTRSVSTFELSLFYAPAGNLLTNPFLEQNDDGWRVFQSLGTAEESGKYERSYAAVCQERPFGMYPVLQTHSEGTTFEQTIKLVNMCTKRPCDPPLILGMFAVGQDNGSCSYASDAIQINLTGEGLSCDPNCTLQQEATDTFQFFMLSETIQLSEEEQKVTLRFAGKTECTSPDSDYDGAVLQYFGAWLGAHEIRFSNDKTNWTDWILWEPASNNAWFINWDLTAYGGNNMEGDKTVYMQTHDLLTDRYYETSSRIIYISPTERP